MSLLQCSILGCPECIHYRQWCEMSTFEKPAPASEVEEKIKELSNHIWNHTSGWLITHSELDDRLRELVVLVCKEAGRAE